MNTDDFKQFVIEEKNKLYNKKYDLDINIRDLYPIDIHLQNKRQDDIDRFNKINKNILNHNGISRRVTKKEIVYKQNKSKSVLSIQISKRNYLKIFMLPIVEKYDINSKFQTISKSNCKPLEKLIIIKNNNDLKYINAIINNYLKELLI